MLVGICKSAGMPSIATVLTWPSKHPEFADLYTRAKEIRLEVMAEEITDLADKCRMGKKTVLSQKDGKRTETGDMVDRSRLQIETRKWLLAKLASKVYGDKLQTEHSGSITTNIADVLRARRAKREAAE